jgi:hypothetical protein
MNYKITNTAGNYSIHETQTEQIIKSFQSKDEAKKFLRHLNFGGSFDGWTPSFMLKKISKPY